MRKKKPKKSNRELIMEEKEKTGEELEKRYELLIEDKEKTEEELENEYKQIIDDLLKCIGWGEEEEPKK